MPTYSITGDAGVISDSGGTAVWDNVSGVAIAPLSPHVDCGLRFDMAIPTVANNTGDLLGEDTPIITLATLNLTADAQSMNQVMDVFIIQDFVPSAFSNTNLPAVSYSDSTNRPSGWHILVAKEVAISSTTISTTLFLDETQKLGSTNNQSAGPITLDPGREHHLTGIDPTVINRQSISYGMSFGGLNSVARHGRFVGLLAFWLRFYDSTAENGTLTIGSLALNAATLVTTEVPQFTGIARTPEFSFSRAVKCGRCARPVQEDTLIEDGYVRGLKVCPECYDPPQRPGRAMRGVPSGSTG